MEEPITKHKDAGLLLLNYMDINIPAAAYILVVKQIAFGSNRVSFKLVNNMHNLKIKKKTVHSFSGRCKLVMEKFL